MKNKILCGLLAGILSVSMVLGNCSSVLAANVKKDETVYVKTDKSGKENSVVVTDQLQNIDGMKEVDDISELKDITNVKGDETFDQNGNKLTWKNSSSNEIVYQGNTNKELPVGIELSYELDGKKIKPEELKGKSGHLKVDVAYKNNTKGNDYVPFLMMTVFIIDEDHFTNITTDEGRVLSDGERETVIGFGVPGIKAFMDASGKNELLEDIGSDIPEGFTLEADVTDYEDVTCISAALNDVFTEEEIDSIDGLDKLNNSMNELQDAATKLVDGSMELSDGTQKLKGASGELVAGVKKLDDGSVALANGIAEFLDGILALKTGAGQLEQGLTQVEKGAEGIGTLAGAITASIPDTVTDEVDVDVNIDNSDIREAVKQTLEANGVSDEIIGQVIANINDKTETKTVSATVEVKSDKTAIGNYSKMLTETATAVGSGTKALSEGASTLTAGLSKLELGAKTLNGGATELNKGLDTLYGGSGELVNGVNDLNNGAIELKDGMKKFNDEGISKLSKIFGDDLKKLVNRVNLLKANASDYKNCTGIADDMDGVVKFIFITE